MADAMSGIASREVLAEQYADDANLSARQAIYRYLEGDPGSIFEWALDLAGVDAAATVVDVGCGNGRYLEALVGRGHRGPAIGVDLSAGMLTAAQRHAAVEVVVGDAQRLPLRDACADAVLAMHMLYHVPDQALAVRELRRVARRGAPVVVATNSTEHVRELDELIVDSVGAVTGTRPPRIGERLPFTLETGADVLGAAFDEVTRHDRSAWLVVPDADAIVAYAGSMHVLADVPGALDELGRRARELIDREGAMRIRTAAGAFVCR